MQIKNIIRPLIPAPVLQLRYRVAMSQFARQNGMSLVVRDLFYDLQRCNTVLRIRRGHHVYLQHMIENFDYYVNSVIPITSEGLSIVDMSGPRYHRLRGFGNIPFLFPSHTEPYNTTTEYLDFANLREGETVVDLGAYAGITSIIFAQLVGKSGHVYAFEADAVNYECAAANFETATQVMGLDNISLTHKAVWSDSYGLLFSNEGAMGSSAVAITGGHRGNEQVIPSIRLEDFFEQHGLSRANFVKMDIEGCEVEVLGSSARFLKEVGARLIVEPHGTTDQCIKLLQSAGYSVNVRKKVGESEALIEAMP